MPYFVYIIECTNKALYTGITNDLKRRFYQHQTGQGGHYTSYNPAVKLRYFEEYATRSGAAKREAQIKAWSRTKKLALIKGDKGFLKAASRCKSRQNRFACLPAGRDIFKCGQSFDSVRFDSLRSLSVPRSGLSSILTEAKEIERPRASEPERA